LKERDILFFFIEESFYYNFLKIYFFFFFLVFLLILLQRIAFLTLWERGVLRSTQLRKGPLKIRFLGVLQPLLDGVKLLKKEWFTPSYTSIWLFIFIPIGSFLFLFLEWLALPYFFSFFSFTFIFLFFLVIIGCGVYPILLSGVSSNSKFAFLGALRARRQTVSFEVLFSILSSLILLYLEEFSFSPFLNLGLFIWFFIFFLCILVELNRAPFDFA
jgi:NADH-ubiquinone oxidoreductase chain 1